MPETRIDLLGRTSVPGSTATLHKAQSQLLNFWEKATIGIIRRPDGALEPGSSGVVQDPGLGLAWVSASPLPFAAPIAAL